MKGGHCPVSWATATRPLELGGLGIPNLEVMSWALRMRWLWLHKTQPDKPWGLFDVKLREKVQAMFRISVSTILGDGRSTLFWTDRWIGGQAIQNIAPALMQFVHRCGWQKHTVHDALQQNNWMQDIFGGLPVLATWQFLLLTDAISTVLLQQEVEDRHVWLPESILPNRRTGNTSLAG